MAKRQASAEKQKPETISGEPLAVRSPLLKYLIGVIIAVLVVATVWVNIYPRIQSWDRATLAAIYAALSTLAMCCLCGATWVWWYNSISLRRDTVHGLKLKLEATDREWRGRLAHLVAAERVKLERAVRDQLAPELAELERLRKDVSTLTPKAAAWDAAQATDARTRAAIADELAVAKAARSEAERLAGIAAEATESALQAKRDAKLWELERANLTAEMATRKGDLEAANQLLEDGARRLDDEEAHHRRALDALEIVLRELKGQLAEAIRLRDEAWEQVNAATTEQGIAEQTSGKALRQMCEGIRSLEALLQLEGTSQFNPDGVLPDAVFNRFAALTGSLAAHIKTICQREQQRAAESTKTQVASVRSLLDGARNDCAKLRQQNDETTQANAVLKRDIGSLTTANTALRQANEAMGRQLAQLEQDAGTLAIYMTRLREALTSPDPAKIISVLSSFGLSYDNEKCTWSGEAIETVALALIMLGAEGVQLVSDYLQARQHLIDNTELPEVAQGDDAAAEEAARGQAKLDLTQLQLDCLERFTAQAISMHSALDWWLRFTPRWRMLLLDSSASSDSFILLVLCRFLAGLHKCETVVESDALHRVRDKLTAPLLHCLYTTLKAQGDNHPSSVAKRLRTVFYGPALLTAMRRAKELVKALNKRIDAVNGEREKKKLPLLELPAEDLRDGCLWYFVTQNPKTDQDRALFDEARKALQVLWYFTPAELSGLVGETQLLNQDTPGAKAARGAMGMNLEEALVFAPTDLQTWRALGTTGDRAQCYHLLELVSVAPESADSGDEVWTPGQLVALSWVHGLNGGAVAVSADTSEMLEHLGRNAARFAAFVRGNFSSFASALKELEVTTE